MSAPLWQSDLLDARPDRTRVQMPVDTRWGRMVGFGALALCVGSIFVWPSFACVVAPVTAAWMLVPWSPRAIELTADRLEFRHPFRSWSADLREVVEVRAEPGVVRVQLASGSKEIRLPGSPELAERLADAMRTHVAHVRDHGALPPRVLGVDAVEPPTGLERWTRWTHDGAELDLSPVGGPVANVVIAGAALIGCAVGVLLARFAFGLGPAAVLGFMLVGVLAAVLPLFAIPHHVLIHVDRAHLRVTRLSRLRSTGWSVPLSEVRAALPYATGVAIDTVAGRRTLPLRDRSRATRVAVAEAIEHALERARDPGSSSEVPAKLRALIDP